MTWDKTDEMVFIFNKEWPSRIPAKMCLSKRVVQVYEYKKHYAGKKKVHARLLAWEKC